MGAGACIKYVWMERWDERKKGSEDQMAASLYEAKAGKEHYRDR